MPPILLPPPQPPLQPSCICKVSNILPCECVTVCPCVCICEGFQGYVCICVRRSSRINIPYGVIFLSFVLYALHSFKVAWTYVSELFDFRFSVRLFGFSFSFCFLLGHKMNMKFLLAAKSCKCKFVNRTEHRVSCCSLASHSPGSPGSCCNSTSGTCQFTEHKNTDYLNSFMQQNRLCNLQN